MKTIVLAIVMSVVLGAAAAYLLAANQTPAYQAYSTSGARVTPTDNLVGPNWTGTPNRKAPASPG